MPEQAVVVRIAEAVHDLIDRARGELSQPFVLEREYVPLHELCEMGTLHVTVVPAGQTLTRLSRGSNDWEYVIDVGVQQRREPTPHSMDPLVFFVQEIVDLFTSATVDVPESIPVLAVSNVPLYAFIGADSQRVFTSVVSLTFRKSRRG